MDRRIARKPNLLRHYCVENDCTFIESHCGVSIEFSTDIERIKKLYAPLILRKKEKEPDLEESCKRNSSSIEASGAAVAT